MSVLQIDITFLHTVKVRLHASICQARTVKPLSNPLKYEKIKLSPFRENYIERFIFDYRCRSSQWLNMHLVG